MIYPRRYVTVADTFGAHWGMVNDALTPDLELPTHTLLSFRADRDALVDLMAEIEGVRNRWEGATFTRDQLRERVHERVLQFNSVVRGSFWQAPYLKLLPAVPYLRSGRGPWMATMATVEDVWGQIDSIFPVPAPWPVPLILPGGYGRADFALERQRLVEAFIEVDNAANALSEAIRDRDEVWGRLYVSMRRYRQAVRGRFMTGQALLESLPRLTPRQKPRKKKVLEPEG